MMEKEWATARWPNKRATQGSVKVRLTDGFSVIGREIQHCKPGSADPGIRGSSGTAGLLVDILGRRSLSAAGSQALASLIFIASERTRL